MSDTSASQEFLNNQIMYPEAFQDAVASIYANIPRLAKGVSEYNITLAKDRPSGLMQFTFSVAKDAPEKESNQEAVNGFNEFCKSAKTSGVVFSEETGAITFTNAGTLAALIEEYLEENPDNLEENLLEKIQEGLEIAFNNHFQGAIAQKENLECKFPISARAFLDSMITIKGLYPEGEELLTSYAESSDSDVVVLKILCDYKDGEDFGNPEDKEMFCDPDHMDSLQALADDLSIYAIDTDVTVKMLKGNSEVVVKAQDPLQMLDFIKKCYEGMRITGIEDAYDHYNPVSAATENYGEELVDTLIDDETKGAKSVISHANIREINRHFRHATRVYGEALIEANPEAESGHPLLGALPLRFYASRDDVVVGQTIGVSASGASFQYVQSRVIQEMNQKRPGKKAALPKGSGHYRIH